jgi:hypothetical protein
MNPHRRLIMLAAALTPMQLRGKVVLVDFDSNQAIWQAWGNQYWPALYLVDANGKTRHHQFGEGGYDKMERAIQSLLMDARPGAMVDSTLVNPTAHDEQMLPDLANLGSGETYLGYEKAADLRLTPKLRENRPQVYSVGQLGLNQWGLSGRWVVGPDNAMADENGHPPVSAGAPERQRAAAAL